MTHVLDRPIWTALNSRHARLAEGGALAKRYPAAVSAFAAAGDEAPECLAALGALAAPGETLIVVQAGPIPLPEGFEATLRATLVQMVAEEPAQAVADARIVRLGPQDAQDMLDLATLTKPGPFTLKAQEFGPFWGIRSGGRLIAMAGQRLGQVGFRELSGVCTHPDVRGQGLGRLMSLYGMERIREAGDVPYLHAYASNATAIGLYESIGFRLRTTMNMAVMRRAG
jgi:ribosomal protein S18 acetylase RimI-like enzyme